MEELIFFAVIIFFSIIESIARKRKQSGQPQIPEEWEAEEPREPRREWRPERQRQEWTERSRETTGVAYDADPSYDELEVEGSEASRRSGSEGMVPSDIWEEIAGLSRGGQPQMETRPEPRKPAPPPPVAAPKVPMSTDSARAAWGKRTPSVGQHRLHLAHSEYGTDPSSRTPSPHDAVDPLARKQSADVRAVRKQIRGGRHALRQAVILQEVLGPPSSMRPEPLPE